MARSSSEIDAIIVELKAARTARDTALENAAVAQDGVDDNKARRLRNAKHLPVSNDDICVQDTLMIGSDGKIRGIRHIAYSVEDRVIGDHTGRGLKTILADESVTITGETTVEGL